MYVKYVLRHSEAHIEINGPIICALFVLTECRAQQGLDVAFLLDGSGSVNALDFERMKDFMRNLVALFVEKDAKVGLFHCF